MSFDTDSDDSIDDSILFRSPDADRRKQSTGSLTDASRTIVDTHGSHTQNASSRVLNAAPLGSVNTEIHKILWEKQGENAILRNKLDKIKIEHQTYINELISQHTTLKDDQKKELDNFKKLLENERVQNQFLLAEMKSRGNDASKSAQRYTSAKFGSSVLKECDKFASPSNDKRPFRVQTRSNGGIDDGFVVKKPKLSNFSAIPIYQGASVDGYHPHYKESEESGKLIESNSSVADLLQFLVNHKAPGFADWTMQILYRVQTHRSDISIGQDLATCLSKDELVMKLISHVEMRKADFSSNVTALLLSLLYDTLTQGVYVTDRSKTEAFRRLCDVLLNWLHQLKPMGSHLEFQDYGFLHIKDARVFINTLWGLDTLIAMDWEFELPLEICRQIISKSYAPQLLLRVLELIKMHPSIEIARFLALHPPKYNDEFHLELLFSGLNDSTEHPIRELIIKEPKEAVFFRCINQDSERLDIERICQSRASELIFLNQCAWTRAAESCLKFSSDQVSLDRKVLSMLNIYTENLSQRGNLVLQAAIMYFWRRKPDELRGSLSQYELTDLIISLTKSVYDLNKDSPLAAQCQQILQDLTSSEEHDLMHEAFRAQDRQHQSYDSMEDDLDFLDSVDKVF